MPFSKGILFQMNRAKLSVHKKNKFIRESGNVRSGQISILEHSEKNEAPVNMKRPRPRFKSAVVDDRRMLSMVKKNHITASRQDTNLHNVDT